MLRHGVTPWNERGVIQGRTDIPLSADGVARLGQVHPCDDFRRAHWLTSPLQRAVQTAATLNPTRSAVVVGALIETSWGDFEGIDRQELPERIRALGIQPPRGLDFAPPGGESMRTVRARLLRWLATLATAMPTETPIVAVTHKGIIRSVLSAACDWDMEADFPQKLDWSLPHIFQLPDGKPRLLRLNCPWDESPRS